MNRIVPLTPELLDWAILEEVDPATQRLAETPGWAAMFTAPGTWGEAMLGRGRVLAAGGLVPLWPGRGLGWLMLSPFAGQRDRHQALTRARTMMCEAQRLPAWRRIEMYVRADEPWCDRFGRLMGMTCEGTMRRFDPLGRDYLLFARVAEEA